MMRSEDPSSRRNVLVVCFGNLCRSPMAEALLRAALPRSRWRVSSAGTHAIGGDPPARGACDAVHQLAGIDISHQRSSPLTVEALRTSDFIFTMSRAQALEAASLYPDATPRIRLFGAFVPGPRDEHPADPGGAPADGREIADPIGADAATYMACCRRIDECTNAVAAWLLGGAAVAAAPPSVAAWLEGP